MRSGVSKFFPKSHDGWHLRLPHVFILSREIFIANKLMSASRVQGLRNSVLCMNYLVQHAGSWERQEYLHKTAEAWLLQVKTVASVASLHEPLLRANGNEMILRHLLYKNIELHHTVVQPGFLITKRSNYEWVHEMSIVINAISCDEQVFSIAGSRPAVQQVLNRSNFTKSSFKVKIV